MIKKGFPQDEEGYAFIEETLTNVMEEMGANKLIAKLNGKYQYVVYPVNQTATERGLRIIRPRVLFRIRNWGYYMDLTLVKTNKDIGGNK